MISWSRYNVLVTDDFLTFLMLYAASTLTHEKARQFSVKHIGGISLRVLIKRGTVVEHGTSKFVPWLQLQK